MLALTEKILWRKNIAAIARFNRKNSIFLGRIRIQTIFRSRDPASQPPCLDHPDRALDALLIAAHRCSRAPCRPGPNSPAPARAAETQVGGPGPDTPCPYHNSRRGRSRNVTIPDPVHLEKIRIRIMQCCGSGSVGSVCFWASLIRIRIH
jgi:hypothetical protein